MYCMGTQPYSSKMLGKSGSGDVEAVGMMLVIVSVSSQLPLSSAQITDWKREQAANCDTLEVNLSRPYLSSCP